MGSKFVKYLSDSIANLSSLVMSISSSTHAPAEESTVPLSSIDMNEKTEGCRRTTNPDNETIVLKRSDYEKTCSELASSRTMIEDLKKKEEECNRMLRNYDATLTYALERNEKEKILLESTIMNEEIERLKSNEYRLKSYIQALKRDLFASEDKMESLRKANNERIEFLVGQVEEAKGMYEEEKRKVSYLSKRLNELEDAFGVRCREMVELAEYCKYLLR
ncbi:uncharacterized protein Eint_071460 [Encephalitozoon intestinalis ATCC 50506]|uniref:Uncharacterized protein n=1 Tax=Encephalitozoon intestinalis (strain ATCC 50506) TaxID=876142 RepID=E0S872_ENCIT|nr:uncharacterized protein Eint_071460 [Encephalitozoon intestinalis ATCC 50506]ADM11907.1 hypothetical protein Eint_071460 [Encephalitozoon intestinalis ATCC 50506]UTX45663.1 hypothetical protein GPK93_07g12300 [Encephalitozoon intestinalis]